MQHPAGGRARLLGVLTDLSGRKLHELPQAQHIQSPRLQSVTSSNNDHATKVSRSCIRRCTIDAEGWRLCWHSFLIYNT